MQFVMGLNTNYDQTRGQILAMDPYLLLVVLIIFLTNRRSSVK